MQLYCDLLLSNLTSFLGAVSMALQEFVKFFLDSGQLVEEVILLAGDARHFVEAGVVGMGDLFLLCL